MMRKAVEAMEAVEALEFTKFIYTQMPLKLNFLTDNLQ